MEFASASHDCQDFAREVLERSREMPVLVDFWAEWCGPCRMLGPVLERVAARHRERFVLVKVNTEQFPDISARYGVRGIPNVKLFVDGEVVNEFTGALPEGQIESWLQSALPDPLAADLDAARERLDAGDRAAAQQKLEAVLAVQPAHPAANLLMARVLLGADNARAVAHAERVAGDESLTATADAVKQIAGFLWRAGDPESLPDSPAKAPYLKAAAAYAAADIDGVLNALIEAVGQDREFMEDGARSALLALFELLGSDDRRVRAARMRLYDVLTTKRR
jgi:thioredoxin